MLLMNAYRRSPTTCHATVRHTDYRVHPSRTWLVVDMTCEIPERASSRDVVIILAAEMIRRLAGDGAGVRVSFEDVRSQVLPGQLELPLPE